MHGKGGTDKLVASLASALRDAGAAVVTPLMPWSSTRIYDKSYEAAMAEIDERVAELRAQGAKRIVVAGHSLGANAALGYGARRDGLAGVVLLAYGHVPDKRGMARKLAGSVAKAREMVAAGKGGDTAEFLDFGGGNDTATATANDLLSWFDPAGPATFSKNAPDLKAATPALCIDGERDKWKRCGEIMGLVPSHPASREIRVDASHKGTPAASVDAVLAWLKTLN